MSPHVIRMWEKRYGAVVPRRTPTNRRLYSDTDIEKLSLLRRAIAAGRSIGQIARMPTKKLLALVTADEALTPPLPPRANSHASTSASRKPEPRRDTAQLSQVHLEACLTAVEQLDPDALETTLTQAAVTLGQAALIEQVIVPLMQRIGDLWRDGALRVAHEHLASAVARTFLGGMRGAFETPPSAPNLIVTSPIGQMHELGALVVAATALSEGWRVTYLGPNLPAEEIAGAAQQNHARAVALSIIYPADDPRLESELKNLRRGVGPEVALLIGGRAAESYDDLVQSIGAVRLEDLRSLRSYLETLRSRPPQH